MGNGKVRRGRWRNERGAALVEFSLVVVMLVLLLFGIITFGYILSFKQGLTQAAAEGARAAAVVSAAEAPAVAEAAAADSVNAFDRECNVDALVCTFALDPTDSFITVNLTYDYDADPLLPPLPLLSALLPNTLNAESTAQVNP